MKVTSAAPAGVGAAEEAVDLRLCFRAERLCRAGAGAPVVSGRHALDPARWRAAGREHRALGRP
ncbi:hypothetical protein ACH4VX_15400 [Streptomyces sp. NPDC020731]|uniref:hypothetical protein n=1 Tax=Streptomyces sp. NPDC020731 TaxID=3365085 RepID=UPI0037986D63